MTEKKTTQEREWPDLDIVAAKIQDGEPVSDAEWETLLAQATTFDTCLEVYTWATFKHPEWAEKFYEKMQEFENKTSDQKAIIENIAAQIETLTAGFGTLLGFMTGHPSNEKNAEVIV